MSPLRLATRIVLPNHTRSTYAARLSVTGATVVALALPVVAQSQQQKGASKWSGAVSTTTPSSNVYTFSTDGSFLYGITSGPGVGGRYSLEGLTLTLDYADGKRWGRTVFATSTSEPIGLIGIDGEVYRRQ